MTENDIVHQEGRFWIVRSRAPRAWVVMRDTNTHSVSDSAYSYTNEGLTLAKARCGYLAKHDKRMLRCAVTRS
jgi:hypothetical protein